MHAVTRRLKGVLRSLACLGFLAGVATEVPAQTTTTATSEPAPVNQPMPAAPPTTEVGTASTPTGPTVDPATGEQLVKGAFSNAPIANVIGTLASQSGKTIAAKGKTVGQTVSLITKPVRLEQALDIIVNSKPNWLVYKPDDQPNTYEIWDQESFRTEVLPKQVRQKYFIPKEITAEEAHKAITGVLTPNIGSAAFDPRSNKLFVTDLPYVLELVQRLLEQIDVKFLTRVFYIRHTDVNTMAERLSNLKSPAAPAPEVDEKTHLIIVRDRFDILRQMELLVETLDVGPDLRVYDINNIGFEGIDLQDLEDAIDEILTPNAFKRINPRAGKMIVEDVEEVHEKIEKILQAFDQPPKQVLVQAEIIETEFKEGFNWGVDYTVSGDLFSSVIDGLTGRTAGSGSTAGSSGSVPVGAGSLNNESLGFLNFREEFPIVSFGGSGVDAQWLSRHAFIRLRTAMSDSRTRILQQPRILVKNQSTADFSVGQKIPFFTGGAYGYGSTQQNGQLVQNASQPQQSLLQVGLDLSVSPTILNNGLIDMEVEIRNNTPLIVDRVFGGQTFTGVGSNNQELATVLIVPSGETRVIGGLVTDAKSDSHSGVPGLIRIPVLGPMLFGNYNRPADDNRRRNLLIFITPTIVLEKPRDLFKYKGRVIVDENAVEEFPVPPATVTDMQCDPAPVELPIDQPLPQLEKGSMGPLVEQITTTEETVTEENGMTSLLPPTEELPLDLEPAAGTGLSPLPRIRVEEQSLPPGMESFVVRGPSGGAMTGITTATASRSHGSTSAVAVPVTPGGQPSPPGGPRVSPGAVSPGTPGIPGTTNTGGVLTGAPTPAPTAAPPPAVTPAVTPGTETKY